MAEAGGGEAVGGEGGDVIKVATSSSAVLRPVLMKEKAHILPQGLYSIPCDNPQGSKVLVLPPNPLDPSPSTSIWPPQVCEVALGSALYVNHTDFPLTHGKHTHFRLVPMEEKLVTHPVSSPVNLLILISTGLYCVQRLQNFYTRHLLRVLSSFRPFQALTIQENRTSKTIKMTKLSLSFKSSPLVQLGWKLVHRQAGQSTAHK